MNESGPAVRALLSHLGIAPGEMLVVYDDMDLPLGTARFRRKGSAGGHRGVKSIIEAMQTTDFSRLKVGIGRVGEPGAVVDYVLSRFSSSERREAAESEKRATEAAIFAVTDGIAAAMNRYNRIPLERDSE